MQTTVHALPAIIPFKFPAVMHLSCTRACIQLVTDDYVIMNSCTRVSKWLRMQSNDAQDI